MLFLPIGVFYLIWYQIFEADQKKYPNGLGNFSMYNMLNYPILQVNFIY
jgi:hypothetical protein